MQQWNIHSVDGSLPDRPPLWDSAFFSPKCFIFEDSTHLNVKNPSELFSATVSHGAFFFCVWSLCKCHVCIYWLITNIRLNHPLLLKVVELETTQNETTLTKSITWKKKVIIFCTLTSMPVLHCAIPPWLGKLYLFWCERVFHPVTFSPKPSEVISFEQWKPLLLVEHVCRCLIMFVISEVWQWMCKCTC